MEKFAAGWARLFLVALRDDPEDRANVAAALLDEEVLAEALARARAFERGHEDVRALARDVVAALRGSVEKEV